MKWFLRLCLCGLLVNLVAWTLPPSLRLYHIHHWMDEWKVALVQHKSEYGMGSGGIVCGRFSREYFAGNRELISQLRQDWFANIRNSKTPSPIDGGKVQYDEWGPSHLIRPDGIEVLEVGFTFTVPYSLGALVCAFPLIIWIALSRSRLHKRQNAGIVDQVEPAPKVTR